MKFSNLPKQPDEPHPAGGSTPPSERKVLLPPAATDPFKELDEKEAAAAKPAKPSPAAPDPGPAEESAEEFDRKVREESLQATEVYSETVSAARQIYRALEKPLEVEGLDIPREALRKLISVVRSDNQEILILADRSAPDNYLYGHVVNVAIFSLRLGMNVGLNENEMLTVAMGAFLHDIGMIPYLPMVLRPTRLSEDELKQVQRHSEEGANLLSKFPSLQGRDQEVISSIVVQVHERMEGMGYPQALGQALRTAMQREGSSVGTRLFRT